MLKDVRKPDSVLSNHLSKEDKMVPFSAREGAMLSTSTLGEQPDGESFGDCSGEDCPFHPSITSVRHCCSNWHSHAPPYDGHPALCCLDFPLHLKGTAIT